MFLREDGLVNKTNHGLLSVGLHHLVLELIKHPHVLLLVPDIIGAPPPPTFLHGLERDIIFLVKLSEFCIAHTDAFLSQGDDSLPERERCHLDQNVLPGQVLAQVYPLLLVFVMNLGDFEINTPEHLVMFIKHDIDLIDGEVSQIGDLFDSDIGGTIIIGRQVFPPKPQEVQRSPYFCRLRR